MNGFEIFTPKFAGSLRTSWHRLSTLLTLVIVLPIAGTSFGCGRDSGASRDAEGKRIVQERIAQDEKAIRAASAAWSKAAQSKDLEKSLTFFADNAILLSPKSPAVEGKENIREVWQQMLALSGPGLSFSAARVEVAGSGDLAWEYGTYEFATSDKEGTTAIERGTYVTVWKKQRDGAWKVVGDIHNASA